MAAGQKSRKPKTSKRIHGSGGKMRTLTAVQLVLLGKGMLVKPVKSNLKPE